MMYQALQEKDIPAELHVFPEGGMALVLELQTPIYTFGQTS